MPRVIAVRPARAKLAYETDSRITDEEARLDDIVSRPHSMPSRHCPVEPVPPTSLSTQKDLELYAEVSRMPKFGGRSAR